MDEETPPMAMVVKITSVRLSSSSLIILMILLLWTICYTGDTEAETENDIIYDEWGYHVGVITIFFGFLFLAIGVPLLAGLFLKLSEKLKHEDDVETSIYKGGEKKKTIGNVMSHILVTVIIMSMLVWAIFSGFRLVKEGRKQDHKGNYYSLSLPVGLITIAFGFLYFFIGISIIAEQLLDLLQQIKRTRPMVMDQELGDGRKHVASTKLSNF